MQCLYLVMILVPMEQPGPGSPFQTDSRTTRSDRLVDIARERVHLLERRTEAIRELSNLELESRKVAIAQLQADIEAAEIGIKLATDREEVAEHNLERTQQLVERGFVGESALASSRMERDQVRAETARAKAERDRAKSRLEEAKLAVRRTELQLVLDESEAKLQLLDARTELERAQETASRSRRFRESLEERSRGSKTGEDSEQPGDEKPHG